MFRLHLYAAVQPLVAQISHSGPRVPAGTRSSLRPLSIEGEATRQNSGEMSREDAKVCLRWRCELRSDASASSAVIASAAKQSRIPPRKDSGLLRCARNDDVERVVPKTGLVPRTQRSAPGDAKHRPVRAPSIGTPCGLLGPGSAQQRSRVAARPGQESGNCRQRHELEGSVRDEPAYPRHEKAPVGGGRFL